MCLQNLLNFDPSHLQTQSKHLKGVLISVNLIFPGANHNNVVHVALDQDPDVALVVEVVVSGEANVRRDDNNTILIDEIKKKNLVFSFYLVSLNQICSCTTFYTFYNKVFFMIFHVLSQYLRWQSHLFVINGQAYHLEIEKEWRQIQKIPMKLLKTQMMKLSTAATITSISSNVFCFLNCDLFSPALTTTVSKLAPKVFLFLLLRG